MTELTYPHCEETGSGDATGGDSGSLASLHGADILFTMDSSWIKVHRKLLDHWIYSDRPEYLRLWVYLLLSANWKESKAVINGEIAIIERGEVLTSFRGLAEKTQTSVQVVKTFLKLAEKDGMICVKSNTAATRIKLMNYEYLQGRDIEEQHTPNTRLTHGQHTPNTIIRREERKKERREEEREESKSMRSRAFTPPSYHELLGYSEELRRPDIAQHCYDYYTANGWMVGKNKMKDWKAAVRTWIRNESKYQKPVDEKQAIRTAPSGIPKQVAELYEKELPSETQLEELKALYLSKVSHSQ